MRLIEDDAFCNCYGFNIIYYIGERQPSIGSNSFYNIFPQFNSSFIKNRAERNDGALSLSLGNDAYIENRHFENNIAGYLQNNNEFYGGAIFIESSFSFIYNNINYHINFLNETCIIN